MNNALRLLSKIISIIVLFVFISTNTIGCRKKSTSSMQNKHLVNGCGFPFYKSSGKKWGRYPEVEGVSPAIYSVIPDDSGGFYIAGNFNKVGDMTRNYIAHILNNGLVDPSWNPNSDGIVRTLAKSGSNIYVGGGFNRIGGRVRNFIACLDSSGHATEWNPNANSPVFSISVDGSNIYAGGAFTAIGGKPRKYLACLNASGIATSWEPNPNWYTTGITVAGPQVYVIGRFSKIGGQYRNYIACLDSSGRATAWDPSANGQIQRVDSIAISDSKIYVCGSFSEKEGLITRGGVVCLDSTSGKLTSWIASVSYSESINAFAVDGSNIYVGGEFEEITPGKYEEKASVHRRNIACIDSSGTVTSWNPSIGLDVNCIGLSNNTVYVACSNETVSNLSGSERLAKNLLVKASDKSFNEKERIECCSKIIETDVRLPVDMKVQAYEIRMMLYEQKGDNARKSGNNRAAKNYYNNAIKDCERIIVLNGGEEAAKSRDYILGLSVLLAKIGKLKEARQNLARLMNWLVTSEEKNVVDNVSDMIEKIGNGETINFFGDEHIKFKVPEE